MFPQQKIGIMWLPWPIVPWVVSFSVATEHGNVSHRQNQPNFCCGLKTYTWGPNTVLAKISTSRQLSTFFLSFLIFNSSAIIRTSTPLLIVRPWSCFSLTAIEAMSKPTAITLGSAKNLQSGSGTSSASCRWTIRHLFGVVHSVSNW